MGEDNSPYKIELLRNTMHMHIHGIAKLPECLFIVSYVVGIDTEAKRHHSQ